MCLGNRAESSAHYINSQLVSLYENAQRCTEKHGGGLKPTMSAIEYATCLFEYYGPGKHSRYQPSRRDLSFYASFGRPRVEFVCNHEVILFLELQDGHYNLDVNRSSPKPELQESIENYSVALRINFSTHSIDKFHCSAIGNSESYTMNMHVLDMDCATFVPELSHLPGITSVTDERSFYTKERKLNALIHYITKFYLQTLKRAGFHVLYSLPDFDNLNITTAHIDYSVISKRTLSPDKIYGISVEDINTYLRGLWLQAATYIDEHGFSHDGSATHKHFLAELRTTWTDTVEDIHMHLYFGPLHIRPLCKREVVMYLDLQDVHVHIGGGFQEHANHKMSDMKIAFIVDIIYEESEDHTTRRIKLDLQSARYCEHLSVFGEFHDIEIFTRIRTTLVRYITKYYLSIIETTETTCIFHHDKSVHAPEGDCDSSDEESDRGHNDNDYHVHDCTCQDEDSCGHTGGIRWGILQKGLVAHTETCDFDLITAVTQGSLNAHFKAAWQLARLRLGEKTHSHTWKSSELEIETCIADYSFVHPEHGDEVFFAGSFAPPKVQLICKEGSYSVIFYLQLGEGYLKTLGPGKSLQPGSHAHSYSNWRLAFEVDLKLVSGTKETIDHLILERIAHKEQTSILQLILDLSSARFNLNLSTVPGLLEGNDCRLIRARSTALAYYIQTCYFPAFQRARHHVLYSIPTLVSESYTHHHHTLTSLKFQIIPFNHGQGESYFEGIFGRHRAIFERNMIVFMGMTCGKPLPPHCLPRGINWACGSGREVPHGTVCFSRKSFLEQRILVALEKINRKTTIVPKFSGIDCGGKWVLKLTTWDKHEMKANRLCNWSERKCKEDSLEFEWKNREDWRYEHDGDFDGNGLYHVNCTTRNTLSIPTTRRDITRISIGGSVDLDLSYCGEGRDWDAKMTVSWEAKIQLQSDPCGMKVQILPAHVVPKIRTVHCHGTPGHSTHETVMKDLEDQFPNVIDFSTIVCELKDIFEGSWAGLHVNSRELIVSHPLFNKRGDLLLELGIRMPPAEVSHEEVETSHGRGIANGNVRSNGLVGSRKGFFRKLTDKAEQLVHSVVTPPPYSSPSSPSLLHSASKTSLNHSTSKTSLSRTSTTRTVEVTEEVDAYSVDEEDL